MNPGKSRRPTREDLRAMVKKLRDVAMYCSANIHEHRVVDMITEADLLLARGALGGYVKKTEVDHQRIKALAPIFWLRMEHGDRVLTIAREHRVNRTTVRKWAKIHQKHRDELLACARVVLGPECEGQATCVETYQCPYPGKAIGRNKTTE